MLADLGRLPTAGVRGQIRNIAADCEDTLYVGCYVSNKVVVFDADDAITGEVAVTSPAGIAVLPALP